jgi:uncharacterized protein
MPRELIVLSGGHPYEAQPFGELLDSLEGWRVTHLIHPEAERLVGDGRAAEADAILFYDMPGYMFSDGSATTRPPSDAYRNALAARFAAGRGAVAMHHALAGWALWPEWHEWLGGRFLYHREQVRGELRPDSGYRHDVRYRARVIAAHPVTAGLPQEFEVTDELYLAQVFADTIEPLVAADHAFVADNFFSAAAAIEGRLFDRDGWSHPEGSPYVAWTSRALMAPIVYLQFGDGPSAYANPYVRRLLTNALGFVASGPGSD